ncbi:GDP/GTP exchange factor for ARF [Purpureocillium takamizusanense]|uniref:GDP/GTP exchange factor for ARF n=1 Tax=Purpureocillium takamizusanense TaxID=2060973 RepID=A0A9Q8VBD1_9HYPO|nr:GDP/GTP exchange factor for ARF [Purpureocillium takamizusanense]UNI20375.1 GDP/GTP exchange factor for ARF [Purpureocillium takamizusanense]
MSRDAQVSGTTGGSVPISGLIVRSQEFHHHDAPRMRYRSRPVSVAVDPISLVISECISITSAIQKHARSPHSSVSAILGGNPNSIHLGPPSPALKGRSRSPLAASTLSAENSTDAIANSRWGLRGQKGKSMQDNPMIAGFGNLRHEIAAVKDIRTFDGPTLLAPFLLVLQAKGTAAPVTILALGALRKFLAYGFVCSESPRFALAMQSLSAAVTHCQFDVSDSAQGEVVLLMILNLMEDMMSGPGGEFLSDESVCDMMGRGLAICSQPRFSPVLRRTAEASMVRMCQIIFEDVKHLEAEAGTGSDDLDHRTQDGLERIRMDEPTTANPVEDLSGDEKEALRGSREASPGADNPNSSSDQPSTDASTEDGSDGLDSVDLKPYSLPSVRELFRVLVNFLDPNDRQHTDTMRVMAMRILHVALEVSGPFIARHPALATIAEDRLCCFLFQLVRSDNMAVLQESLIVAGTLLATCRGVLKLQQELFLSYLVACLHPTVPIPREPGIDPSLYSGIPETPKLVKPPASQQGSGRSTPVPVKDRQKLGLEGGARKPDARQAMVESVGVLSRMPTFVTELFVNYDCDEDRADMCEDLIGLLSRNALPDSATWSTTSVPPLCLDALLRYIQFLAERLEEAPTYDGYPKPAVLREQRRRKRIIVRGTSKFNEKPKIGLGYLEAQGILVDAKDPVEVARLLKGTSRVSKSVLGDFLSKKGNEAVLNAFMDEFDFSNKRVDEALRILLETFRLPGEAPLIASIVESFSEKYCSGNTPEVVANKDAVFILTYAIIILNTDQHNPNLKSSKRMTFDDFSRNLRGQNDGQDFPVEFLRNIFDSIKSNEIILPDEHDNKHAFDYAWRELLLKSESAGDLIVCNTNIYDGDMFAATWRPIVSTLSYVFMSASDDAVFARIVTGFDECARIAAKYENSEALDQIVYSLSHMSTLAVDLPSSTSLNTEVQVGDNSVMVSELAVKLGRDFRAQLATLVLFRVITGNEPLIRRSWKYVIQLWRNLFVNALVPPFPVPDGSPILISPIPLQTPSQVIDRASRSVDTGFFSAFTSYISSYAADDPPEPSEEELESTLCSIDCVRSCNMDVVFSNIMNMPATLTAELVQSMLDQIPDDDQAGVISVKQDTSTSPTNGQNSVSSLPRYDPGTPYILEFSTILATRDAAAVERMGKLVFDTAQRVLREPGQWHPITLSRAAFYALYILKKGYDHDFANVPFLLHSISSLPQDVVLKTSDTILKGLATCTGEPGPLRSEMMTSPDFWAILRILAAHEASAALVFDILEKSGVGSPPAIMADNYQAAVTLLDYFASSASTQPVSAKAADPAHHRQGGGQAKHTTEQNQTIARACRAVNMLHSMTARVPQLMQQSHLETSEAWSAYWLPIFEALMTQCTNPCREVRQLAFSAMQRSLLSPELTYTDAKEWTAIFSKVLFPLILRLLKPEVFTVDRDGMSEMRVQSASLLCKVFLQYLVLLSEWDGMQGLWVKVIDVLDRLLNSGQGDSLEEAVRENLKNVVLFMSSSGLLVSPAENPARQELWDETWKRVDRFLPDLRNDLAAEGADEREAVSRETEEGTDVGHKTTLRGADPAREGEGDEHELEGDDQVSQG